MFVFLKKIDTYSYLFCFYDEDKTVGKMSQVMLQGYKNFMFHTLFNL